MIYKESLLYTTKNSIKKPPLQLLEFHYFTHRSPTGVHKNIFISKCEKNILQLCISKRRRADIRPVMCDTVKPLPPVTNKSRARWFAIKSTCGVYTSAELTNKSEFIVNPNCTL